MRFAGIGPLVVAMLMLGGCSGEKPTPTVQVFIPSETSVGYYCGMNILEHPGPKGQIVLEGNGEAVWFSSARDAIAFTMLPEEPRNIAAVYVSDMAAAPSWDEPGVDNWIEAREAFFVIGSSRRGGMGAAEAVPFSTEAAARSFVTENGGDVVTFSEIPSDYVLGSASDEGATPDPVPPHSGMSH